jgi:hypothetical protein
LSLNHVFTIFPSGMPYLTFSFALLNYSIRNLPRTVPCTAQNSFGVPTQTNTLSSSAVFTHSCGTDDS